jgi:hypothetical protein
MMMRVIVFRVKKSIQIGYSDKMVPHQENMHNPTIGMKRSRPNEVSFIMLPL